MKYIRTKDGIYKWDCPIENLVGSEIVKGADTIEELCDEFVLFYMETKDLIPIPWATYERMGVWKNEKEHVINEVINHPSYREPVLFGAIWTEKGLIYVAKMNDKGDLELI